MVMQIEAFHSRGSTRKSVQLFTNLPLRFSFQYSPLYRKCRNSKTCIYMKKKGETGVQGGRGSSSSWKAKRFNSHQFCTRVTEGELEKVQILLHFYALECCWDLVRQFIAKNSHNIGLFSIFTNLYLLIKLLSTEKRLWLQCCKQFRIRNMLRKSYGRLQKCSLCKFLLALKRIFYFDILGNL